MRWDGGVRRLQMEVRGTDPSGTAQHVFPMLRGHTVDVLALLDDGTNLWVIFVGQWRMPIAEINLSNPSGSVEEADFKSTALNELNEELNTEGVELAWSPLVNMGALLTGSERPFTVSPGGIDEYVTHYVTKAKVSPAAIKALHGRVAGLQHEGERTTSHVIRLDKAFAYQAADDRAPDEKTIASLLMYLHLRGLYRGGQLAPFKNIDNIF
ncbi:MAG TPA: hypothetical protein VFZ58_02255 [Candidatus Saccharimonadales bacterium]